jgi:hypothetical protein
MRLMTVSGEIVGQRVVGQDQPVPQHVRDDLDDVLRDDVVAAADQGQGPRGGDDAQRCARRGAEGDPAFTSVIPNCSGRGSR